MKIYISNMKLLNAFSQTELIKVTSIEILKEEKNLKTEHCHYS